MRTLASKLTFAFLGLSVLSMLLVALFSWRATATEFNSFVMVQAEQGIVPQLQAHYLVHQGWTDIERAYAQMGPVSRRFALLDAQQVVIVPGAGYPRQTRIPEHMSQLGIPIEVNGQLVGILLPDMRGNRGMMGNNPGGPAGAPMMAEQDDFMARVNQVLLWALIGTTGMALIIGILLAQTLTRPLQELTRATRAVASGRLGEQVPIRSQDELGALARSFNRMSADLLRASEQRRQMTADIAHELRTPLSIILGHAEALHDQVLPPTPETFAVIHDEARRLQRLIEELRTLSLAEAGELSFTLTELPVQQQLDYLLTAYMPAAQQQGVTLSATALGQSGTTCILVDPDRMAQVWGNLLGNALHYVPEGGGITVQSEQIGAELLLRVHNDGPPISAAEQAHIFDRFYRTDAARERHGAGSGLGLAIVKSLVEGQNGRVSVQSSPETGVTFQLHFPATSSESA